MITFIGAGRIKSEKLEEVCDAIREFVVTIRDEDGTTAYVVSQMQDDPQRIVFFEQYADNQAREAHHANPELPKLKELLMSSMEEETGFMGLFDIVADK